jgi:hypothetical protein
MEVVLFVRRLWPRRIPVAIGAVVALALGFAVGGSPVAPSGLAATQVLVDTPRSELIANSAHGMDTLYWRATLLAMRLGTEPARQQIAREAQVPASQIAVIEGELTAPANPAALPVAAVQAASATPQPYVLTLQTDNVLPIVGVQTIAPNRAGAARLAEAAVHALQSGASPQDTRQVQGLNITQVDPVTAVEKRGGAGLRMGALTTVVAFSLWCVGVALWPRRQAPRRGRRLLRWDRVARA